MEGYIKMNLKEIGYEFENFIQLALYRDQSGSSCEYGNEPLE